MYKHDVRESKLQNFFSKNKDSYLDEWWQARLDAIKKAEDDAAEKERLAQEALNAKSKGSKDKEKESPRKGKEKESKSKEKGEKSGGEDYMSDECLKEEPSVVLNVVKIEEEPEIVKRPTNNL